MDFLTDLSRVYIDYIESRVSLRSSINPKQKTSNKISVIKPKQKKTSNHKNSHIKKLAIKSQQSLPLNDTDQSMIVTPRQTDQATTWVLQNDIGERNADGVEGPELLECGLGVELDDLGIVAAESDRTAEWGVGDFVAAEIDVPPLHR